MLSLPNFFEGIVGVITLTFIGLWLQHRNKKKIKRNLIYILATITASIYVITQEFKLHNLGGNNVFDMYDVVFSIIGLFIGYLIIVYIQPEIKNT